MEPIKTQISVGKYKFQIIDNTLARDEDIYSRNFKIGGISSECVNVSIGYRDNIPISASIPYIIYDPECSIETPLDRGEGSVIMIKTLLNHIHRQLPTLTDVKFEDKSNIECATDSEIEKKSSRFRKKGTNVYPIPLYYFSIAFNGETWYEKHFRARHRDIEKHAKYRDTVNMLLHDKVTKESTPFIQFLRTSQPPMEIVDELESYYRGSATFGEFFQSIPREHRCRLVRDWISTFMAHYLRDIFDNTNWIIELPIRMSGGRKNTRKYYCPKSKIRHSKTFRDFGVSVLDI